MDFAGWFEAYLAVGTRLDRFAVTTEEVRAAPAPG
jgi:hypothetical protein